MKLLFKFFFLTVILGVFSCQENKTVSTENQETQKTDSSKIDLSQEDTINPYDKEREMLIKEAKEKIKILIKENKNEKVIKYNYERISKVDIPRDLSIEINAGNIFTESDIHAVLYVSLYTVICIYHYDLKSESLQTVLYLDEYGSENYQRDAIRDVNGDNKKDLIIDLYQMSGCCWVQPFDVYLFQSKTKFTGKYEFVNPTFYPKEQVIRGITYGKDGIKYEEGLYKYKWNGLEVDTVEFIYQNEDDKTGNTYFKTNQDIYTWKNTKKIKLNSIPKEYYSIDNFDVFQRR